MASTEPLSPASNGRDSGGGSPLGVAGTPNGGGGGLSRLWSNRGAGGLAGEEGGGAAGGGESTPGGWGGQGRRSSWGGGVEHLTCLLRVSLFWSGGEVGGGGGLDA